MDLLLSLYPCIYLAGGWVPLGEIWSPACLAHSASSCAWPQQALLQLALSTQLVQLVLMCEGVLWELWCRATWYSGMVGGTIPLRDTFHTSGVRISLPEVAVFSGGFTGPGLSSEHPGKKRWSCVEHPFCFSVVKT